MKNKRKARVLALQSMYAYDIREHDDIITIFDTIVNNVTVGKEVKEYARKLIVKATADRDAINTLLQKHTANWEVKRMAVIDRNILRLAITELRLDEKVPFKVVIDEAVEIAKIYGTDESGKFIKMDMEKTSYIKIYKEIEV